MAATNDVVASAEKVVADAQEVVNQAASAVPETVTVQASMPNASITVDAKAAPVTTASYEMQPMSVSAGKIAEPVAVQETPAVQNKAATAIAARKLGRGRRWLLPLMSLMFFLLLCISF